MNNDLHKMLRKSIHRNNKGKANMDYIDVNAINKEVFPDETPQMAKDQLKRKLYGESINEIGDTPKGQYMIGQAAHKVRNDDVRRQRISNYLRDKYGWTPREYFEGQNDASYGVNKYKTQEGVPPFIEPYIRKVAKESVDRFTEEEQSRINEIGDTPRGQYALGKVAGRARGRIDNRQKGEFSRKDIRKFKETEGYASSNPTDNFQDGYWDAYNNEYYKRYGNPYEKWNESKSMNKALIKLTESDLHNIVKESVHKIINESMYQDSYDWTLSTLDRRLKKHSIEDVISFAKQELQFMDNMTHRMNGQDKGQYDAYRDFVMKYQHQGQGMKIADLKEFGFYIGNTMAGSDVVASNEGIFVDDELVNTYDPNVVINEPHDLVVAIDDAISRCPVEIISDEDLDGLGCYLGADLSIKDWWKENYG